MRDLAPQIYRQRLIIEAYYSIEVDAGLVSEFLTGLAGRLGLRTYGRPIVFSPQGQGKDVNQGFDAFVPLIDSGISLYVWSEELFCSVLVYSCKEFDQGLAVEYAKSFFKVQKEIAFQAF